MSDSVDRNICGNVYVEISSIEADGVQVEVATRDGKSPFTIQPTDADGVAGEIVEAQSFTVLIDGTNNVTDLADALHWLADRVKQLQTVCLAIHECPAGTLALVRDIERKICNEDGSQV